MECGLISKHVHHQLARCNPLFHIFSVLVPTGFVLVGLKKNKNKTNKKIIIITINPRIEALASIGTIRSDPGL